MNRDKIARLLIDSLDYPPLSQNTYGEEPYFCTINVGNGEGKKPAIYHIQKLFDRLVGVKAGSHISKFEFYQVFPTLSIEEVDRLFNSINKNSKQIGFFEFADFLLSIFDKKTLVHVIKLSESSPDDLDEESSTESPEEGSAPEEESPEEQEPVNDEPEESPEESPEEESPEEQDTVNDEPEESPEEEQGELNIDGVILNEDIYIPEEIGTDDESDQENYYVINLFRYVWDSIKTFLQSCIKL